MSERSRLGRQGEDLAANLLVEKGCTIVTRRWRGPSGEIDIVALDGETLVFVEVKARSRSYLRAVDAVDDQKVRNIIEASDAYLRSVGGEGRQIRYDIVTIDGHEIVHLPDAFRP